MMKEKSLYTILRKEHPRTWRIWYRMNRRAGSQNYGYIDVSVCDRWNIKVSGQQGFVNFFDDMGASELDLEIDRINPFGDYEPSNCRWVTPAVNRQNTRNAYEKHEEIALADKNGISRRTFYGRLRRGWNIMDAATLPPSYVNYKHRIL